MPGTASRTGPMATRDRWFYWSRKMAGFGSSSARAPKCAVGSFRVKAFATNFLACMRHWRRRTIGMRRASWWSGD